jgi:hypothetical protein
MGAENKQGGHDMVRYWRLKLTRPLIPRRFLNDEIGYPWQPAVKQQDTSRYHLGNSQTPAHQKQEVDVLVKELVG